MIAEIKSDQTKNIDTMKFFKNTIYILLSLIFFTSCKKFTDVQPKGVIIAENIADFESILNSDRPMDNPFGLSNSIVNASDDRWAKSFSIQNNTSADVNLYFWRQYINTTTDTRADVWGDFYNAIANLNVITEGVLTAPDGTIQKKKQLYAEAMVSKAYLYHLLLNFFSPAYTSATANTDYGVPYVISTDVSTPIPARPSLQQSYTRIIADIKNAIADLPEKNINNTRLTKTGAQALLCRVYMSMGDYSNAALQADTVLANADAQLVDYNEYIGTGLPPTNVSPEELWVKYSNNNTFNYSQDLVDQYDVNTDLRFLSFASLDANGTSYSYGKSGYNPNRGITYAEVYLNKAECLARANKITEALDIINTTIREKRFAPADYTPLVAATKEDAINAVLQERRRELAFKGDRWIDMKRLDAEGRMPVVNRYANDGTTILVSLDPKSKNYTFQIPLSVQAFNPGIPLNK
jgi:tetratricopeptide (TPR) repeat protein